MMGVFAFFNGWIYNEYFAIPLNIFGSCYDEEAKVINSPSTTTSTYTYGYAMNTTQTDCVYTIGLDPRWG
jgi:V-type H+-transporting ATPase subunit a